MNMTQQIAEYLAADDRDYVARKVQGQWVVWSCASDHAVDFDQATIDRADNALIRRAVNAIKF